MSAQRHVLRTLVQNALRLQEEITSLKERVATLEERTSAEDRALTDLAGAIHQLRATLAEEVE